MLDQLDQQCLSVVCSKLAPRELVLLGATCKLCQDLTQRALQQTTQHWQQWLACMHAPAPFPPGWHARAKARALDALLMRFALADHGAEAARLDLDTASAHERRWLRQRCMALGLAVSKGYTKCSSELMLRLVKPQGWQMRWESEPSQWSPQCDDCGAPCPVDASEREGQCHLCARCYTHYTEMYGGFLQFP